MRNLTHPTPFRLCGGGTLNETQAFEFLFTRIDNFWTFPFAMVPDTMCFRSYGWAFMLVGVMSVLGSFGCFVAAWILRREPWHRVALYLFFAVSMLSRGVFCLASFQRLEDVKVRADLLDKAPWFRDYLMPVNAGADLVAAWVDVLLTWFWVKALGGVPTGDWRPMVGVMAVSSVVLAICIGVDSSNVDRLANEGDFNEESGLKIWEATLIYVGVMMTVTAVLHFASVTYLLRHIVRERLHKHPGFRHQMIKVCSIAAVTILCSVTRGLCVLLRFGTKTFESGPLSFNEPVWTAFYYTVLVLLPAYVVAVAYAGLVLQSLRFRLHGDREALAAAAARGNYDSTSDPQCYLEPSTDRFVLPDD
eukprot:CAMPEP_0174860376 /NCGR_PEP_ID=MMETSP1114-20130205/49009_1 /TAXON_ID=312471 /ORGANISM="Neobodo designis, Strain CCAP 1951/1" /LENGTH=361 /DNA_ID=CAMNT_0016095353 /DNA_START=78 /DNA_END=1163 /DNA_ORIENTATION=+